MLETVRHIEYLLSEHNCVLIPGLGGFVMQDFPARYIAERNMFCPPSRSIVFNPTLTYNDGLLAASFMRAHQCSYQQATNLIEQDIATLYSLLRKEGDRVAFGRIGYFLLSENNTLTFEARNEYLFNLDHFGLPILNLLPAGESTSIHHELCPAQESHHNQEEPVIHITIRRRVLRRILATAALFALLFLISTPLNQKHEADQAALSLPTAEEIAEATAEAKIVEITEVNDDMNNQVTPGEYLIVISTLNNRENALLQLQKFHNKGITQPIYLFEDGHRTYLYTHTFTHRKEAYTFLQKQLANETPFPDAWVMRATFKKL